MEKDVYDKLMEELAFEPEEARDYKPKLKEGLKKWEVTEEMVKMAVEKYIPETLDPYESFRKIMKMELKECLGIPFIPKETRIVNMVLPQADLSLLYAWKVAGKGTIWTGFLDWEPILVLGQLFRCMDPWIAIAERYGLDIDQATCPLQKTRYAGRLMGILPSIPYTLLDGWICDDSPLCEEMNKLTDGTHVYHIPRARDVPKDVWEDEDDTLVGYLAEEIRISFEELSEEIGIKVTDADMSEAIEVRNMVVGNLVETLTHMRADPIPISGKNLLPLAAPLVMAMNFDYKVYADLWKDLNKELKRRVDAEEGVMPKGTPRVMWETVSPHGQNIDVMITLEKLGIAAYWAGAFIVLPRQIMPVKYKDPYYIMAARNLQITSNLFPEHKAESWVSAIEAEKLDGIIASQIWYCRHWGTDGLMMEKLMREKMPGFPVKAIDFCWCYDRDYGPERMRTPLETFAEMVKMYKAKKTAGSR